VLRKVVAPMVPVPLVNCCSLVFARERCAKGAMALRTTRLGLVPGKRPGANDDYIWGASTHRGLLGVVHITRLAVAGVGSDRHAQERRRSASDDLAATNRDAVIIRSFPGMRMSSWSSRRTEQHVVQALYSDDRHGAAGSRQPLLRGHLLEASSTQAVAARQQRSLVDLH